MIERKIDKRDCIIILDRFIREKKCRPAAPLFGAFVKAVNASDIEGNLDAYYASLSGFVAALPSSARHRPGLTKPTLSVSLLSVMNTEAMAALFFEPFLLPFIQKWHLTDEAWEAYERLAKRPLLSPELDDALGVHDQRPKGEREGINQLLAAGFAEKGEKFSIHPIVPPPISFKLIRHMVNNVRAKRAIKAKELEPGSPEYFRLLFAGTGFDTLLNIDLPFIIPQKVRNEHGWILAPPGTGKTQLIQLLVSRDLPKVAENRRSVVVMDSSGDLLKQLRRLALFAPGGSLHGKLIVIEPDVEYPLALNPFDMGRSRLASYSPRERERLHNSTLDLLEYVFNSLMGQGATLTEKQSTLFRYCVRLCMVMPGATLQTLAEVLSAADVLGYAAYVTQLDEASQSFFARQFSDQKLFGGTKQEVAWRIMRLLENNTFRAMFTAPSSRLDLFTELNSSKVILINTDKELLKEERTTIFGRFFIALLLSASQERASLEREERLPVHCYIDEAQDYIRNDPNIAVILDQARKMNIGMMLANQRTAQITTPNVLDALLNTSIKFVHTDNPRDASMLAPSLRTSASFISSQKKQHFAVYVRGLTSEAMSVKVPFLVVEGMPKMSEADAAGVRQAMRERYARDAIAPAKEPRSEPSRPSAEPEPPAENGEVRPFDGKPPNPPPPKSSDGLRPERDII